MTLASLANPLFEQIEQPGIGRYPAPGPVALFGAVGRPAVRPAPLLGADTETVFAEHLQLGTVDLVALREEGVI